MILSLLLSFLVVLLTGVGFVSVLWPRQGPMRSNLVLKLCLAAGIGLGILSCVYFLQLSLFGPSRRMLILTQIALLALLIVIFFYRLRLPVMASPSQAAEEPPNFKLRRLLLAIFIMTLVSSTIAFIFISLKQPHGEWDAWAVYNMKARFLFRAGNHWRELFSQPMEWAGPDYPLLVPATIAAWWTLMARETTAIQAVVAGLFTFAAIGIVTCAVAVLRTKSQGLLSGLIVACTPFFISHGANQYSDIPIGFFFLTTLVLLHFHDRFMDGGEGFLILAGLTTGLTAWTKNEGLLFLIAVLTSRLAVAIKTKELRAYFRQIRFFAIGLMPILFVVFYFKITLAARSGLLFGSEGPSLTQKLLDFARYFTIVDTVVAHALSFGSWAVSITPVLVFYLLLVGVRMEERDRASVAGSALALAIMLVGYSAVYVFSPRDVYWHIMASIDRLYSQLWPSLVFVFFLAVPTPEQALAKKEVIAMPA